MKVEKEINYYVENIGIEDKCMDIIDKMALDLKLDKVYITHIISRSMFYYRDFTIPKKNGGERLISQPSPELKTLQYWMVCNVFNKIQVSQAACAYKKGDSIKKHAELHSKSRFIFHTDIKDFFPSIHSRHLMNILDKNKKIFDDLEIDLEKSKGSIKKICFRKDALCIGAVSSPIISNIIMKSFDDELLRYCNENGYIYSRYADDIYISSNRYIDKEIIEFLQTQLVITGFLINYKKTKFYSPKYRRKVTGIYLTEKSHISIGLKRRKEIRKMIYEKLVNNNGEPNRIIGYLSFLKDIEPNTYNNYIIKYSKYCDGDIIAALRKKVD